ncbi:MAG: GNAT family protein [Burkholderiales bacterium]
MPGMTSEILDQAVLRVARLTPEEQGLMQPLFAATFGHPMNEALMRYKYAPGQGYSVGVWDTGDRLVAHCGVFKRRVLMGGVPRTAVQLGDLMGSPQGRRHLSRRGSPFFMLIDQVLSHLPQPDNPEALAYGFPSDRSMRLGEALGVFVQCDSLVQVAYPTAVPGAMCSDRALEIAAWSTSVAQEIDAAWAAMAQGFRADLIGVRDAQYLAWRYFKHPGRGYRLYRIVGLWKRTIGFVVLKPRGVTWELMDMVGSPEHLPRLITAARRLIGTIGGQTLMVWLTGRWAERLGQEASNHTLLEFRIMANPRTPQAVLDRFNQRWWLTSGDTDYR